MFAVGGALGALAGFYGGWIDAVVSRITDVFFGIPLLLAAIVLDAGACTTARCGR